jgi:hypothetical protein
MTRRHPPRAPAQPGRRRSWLRSCRTWCRSRLDVDDRGSNVVELAVLAPAQAGAQIARESAARTGNWNGMAEQASRNYYTDLNTKLLSSLRADAHGDPANQVFVTVTGPLGYSVFNWFGVKWTVTETAGGPVECFRGAADGGNCG